MYAVWRGFVDVTKLLIDAAAKKDAKANNGARALTIAQGTHQCLLYNRPVLQN